MIPACIGRALPSFAWTLALCYGLTRHWLTTFRRQRRLVRSITMHRSRQHAGRTMRGGLRRFESESRCRSDRAIRPRIARPDLPVQSA